MKDQQRLTVDIPQEVHKAMKLLCVENVISIRQFVITALIREVSFQKEAMEREGK